MFNKEADSNRWLRLLAVGAVAATLALVGCEDGDDGENGAQGPQGQQGAQGPAGPAGTGKSMDFASISVPVTEAEKSMNRSSTEVTINGTTHTIGYTPLVRTNDQLQKLGAAAGEMETFGLLKDNQGNALMQDDGSPWVCTNGSGPDYTSMLTVGDDLFAVTQLECSTGGAYITKLNQDAATGALSAVSTRSVDFAGVYGTYVNCAGMTTPWNTHLGSEEYEPPMAKFNPAAADAAWFDAPGWHDAHMESIAEFNGWDNTAENAVWFGYHYGWTPEISLTDADGGHTVVKHYSMGRFAHELAYVMPDNKTVYLSDDGSNVGLFMFVADTAGDLSAGTLYAAKWIQESTANWGGSASIEWINLGHATSAEILDAMGTSPADTSKITFADMFELADPTDPDAGTCPDGFRSTRTYDEGHLCSKLKEGQFNGTDIATLASRLETRLYAAYMGATTEFEKEEGITYNPDDKVLYVVMSRIRRAMLDGDSRDVGGNNDIRLGTTANSCGAVYGMDVMAGKRDFAGNTIDSDHVVGNMYTVIAGEPTDYTGTIYEGNVCSVNGIAEPDNATYLPGYGILVIGEDTGRHQNDMIWALNVWTGELERIATTPYGAETTSPFWHTNVGGYGYMTVVTQHPFGESDADKATGPDDLESYIGYIGPFPALD